MRVSEEPLPPRLGLRAKLIIAAAAIVAGINGAAVWHVLTTVRSQLLVEARERGRLISYAVERGAVNLMLLGEANRLQEFMQSLKGHSNIAAVRLVNMRGIIVASSEPGEAGKLASATRLGVRLPGKEPRLITREDEAGKLITVVDPLRNQPACHRCHSAADKFRGTLAVSVSVAGVLSRVDALRRYQIATGAGSLAAMIAALWVVISVLIGRPIKRFMRAIAQVRRGDLSTVVEVRQRDELGALADQFNAMVGEINEARRRLEEYHRREIAQAGRLASLGEMLSGLAHEIRNPLAGILGAMAVLEESDSEADQKREIAREVKELVLRLNKTAESILTYARSSPPCLEPIDIHQVLDYSLFLVGADKSAGEVKVVRRYCREVTPLVGDPKQLQQVFVNLLLNSLQAIGGKGQIIVSTGSEGADGVRITIADSGPGIDPAHRHSIFEPFFTTKTNGTGLGLAISRRLLEAHGGSIEAEDSSQGAAFVVRLPRQPPVAAGEA